MPPQKPPATFALTIGTNLPVLPDSPYVDEATLQTLGLLHHIVEEKRRQYKILAETNPVMRRLLQAERTLPEEVRSLETLARENPSAVAAQFHSLKEIYDLHGAPFYPAFEDCDKDVSYLQKVKRRIRWRDNASRWGAVPPLLTGALGMIGSIVALIWLPQEVIFPYFLGGMTLAVSGLIPAHTLDYLNYRAEKKLQRQPLEVYAAAATALQHEVVKNALISHYALSNPGKFQHHFAAFSPVEQIYTVMRTLLERPFNLHPVKDWLNQGYPHLLPAASFFLRNPQQRLSACCTGYLEHPKEFKAAYSSLSLEEKEKALRDIFQNAESLAELARFFHEQDPELVRKLETESLSRRALT